MILSIEIEEKNEIDVELAEDILEIDFEFSGGISKAPYEGEYEITPRIKEQILPTKDKYMKNNLTIYQTPFSVVSNPEGGQTVTIGLE